MNAKKIKMLVDKCNKGDGTSCVSLGDMYAEGIEAEEDKFKAFKYCKMGCDLNNLSGCYAVGGMYEHGKGVKKDYFEAIEFYKRSGALTYDWDCDIYNRLKTKIDTDKENAIEKPLQETTVIYRHEYNIGDKIYFVSEGETVMDEIVSILLEPIPKDYVLIDGLGLESQYNVFYVTKHLTKPIAESFCSDSRESLPLKDLTKEK